jgi:hypothetical protein
MATRLSRGVLNPSETGHQYDAAWDLLEAVRELFPEKFEELMSLGDDPEFGDLDIPIR